MEIPIPLEMRGPDFVEGFGTKEQWMKMTNRMFDELGEKRIECLELINKNNKKEATECLEFIARRIFNLLEEHNFIFKPERLEKFLMFFVTGDDRFI